MSKAFKHLVDFLTVRALGVCILLHETLRVPQAEWILLTAGVFLVLAPDAARGRTSLLMEVVRAVAGRGTQPASSEETP